MADKRKSEVFLEALEELLASVPMKDEVQTNRGMTTPEDALSPNYWRRIARMCGQDILASVRARNPDA